MIRFGSREDFLDTCTFVRFREYSEVHAGSPVASLSATQSPVWTERAMATNARTAARPSSTVAPNWGVPFRIESANPSTCNLYVCASAPTGRWYCASLVEKHSTSLVSRNHGFGVLASTLPNSP